MNLPDSDSEDELPPRWEERVTVDGSVFYANHLTKATQWTHPRTGKKKKVSGDLPFGWERCVDKNTGKIVYVDHENKRTTYTDPRLAFAVEEKEHANDYRQRFDASSTALQVLHGRDLNKRTALITGANTGIGFETARSLAKHGCSVIFACRNVAAAKKAIEKIAMEKPGALEVCEAVQLDLGSLKSVLEAANYVKSKYQLLDMLILNAGVFGMPYGRTIDGFETTFQVNHLSHFYLTLLLKPLLTAGSRVVVVSSESHSHKMEPVADNYQLKWHSFASYLHASVAASVANEHFADAALFTVDGHRILAHRFILSTSSQYFHQILKLHHKLNSTLPIMIIMPPEISYKTLKTLIQYMYSGETTVSKDILEHVLRGGDILKIRGLWRPKEDEQEKVPAKPHQKQAKPVAAKEAPPTENRKLIYVKQPTDLLSTKSHTSTSSEPTNEQALTPTPSESNLPVEKEPSKNSVDSSNNQMQYLVIKEEPLEWSEVNESEMELVNDMFHTEMTIKPEICMEQEASEGEMYSPLTCELCTETFKIPGEWVKHIQTHTDMLPAKRRRGKSSVEDDDGTFPPLQCHMCEKYFPTPAEWVHHIQNVHSETEMRMSNKQQSNSKESRECAKLFGRTYQPQHKVCSVCYKKFPSHASMLIHRRTHTGEKPYMCRYCSKGFNVKSNLLRHLRTLHDKIVNSSDVADVTEEDGTTNEEENQ